MQVGQGVEENLAGLSGKGSPRQRLLVLRPEKRRGGVGVKVYNITSCATTARAYVKMLKTDSARYQFYQVGPCRTLYMCWIHTEIHAEVESTVNMIKFCRVYLEIHHTTEARNICHTVCVLENKEDHMRTRGV